MWPPSYMYRMIIGGVLELIEVASEGVNEEVEVYITLGPMGIPANGDVFRASSEIELVSASFTA